MRRRIQCPDCRFCQACAPSRCRRCRPTGPRPRRMTTREQIRLYARLNPDCRHAGDPTYYRKKEQG